MTIIDPPCSFVDPELHTYQSGYEAQQARAICHQCPFKKECARIALEHTTECHGTWGGVTIKHRSSFVASKKSIARLEEVAETTLDEIEARQRERLTQRARHLYSAAERIGWGELARHYYMTPRGLEKSVARTLGLAS